MGHSLVGRLANTLSEVFSGKSLHYRRQFMAMLQYGISERKWDVLHVEGAFVGALLDSDLPIPKVLSVHDSWTLRAAEMVKCAQSLREKTYYTLLSLYEPRFERLLYPRFERCTVVAQPDLDEVRKVAPKARVDLIPYGTDSEYFHDVGINKETTSLVFHSHLGYAPNVEASLEFANDIFPLVQAQIPEARLHLIGAKPGPSIMDLANRPGIKISADLPDLRAAVCSGEVYVSAIRHGTGLKSKILEAMAMRMPIVCYPASAVGIACEHGRELLIAQNNREFAAYVVELLRNPERRESLATAARALVERHYSWESRAQMYEELYQRVILERRGSGFGATSKTVEVAEQNAASD
jgi:glycosyltransferase involved in cell wall biosynthesis